MTTPPEHTPVRFTITPEGAAGLFLKNRFGAHASRSDQEALADMLKIYWQGGYDTAKADSNFRASETRESPEGHRHQL